MRKSLFLLFLIGLFAFFQWAFAPRGLETAQAATSSIYMHYFESIDISLAENSTQVITFSAEQGKQITIVVYGLDPGVSPGVILMDTAGVTLAEDLNPNLNPVVHVTAFTETDGFYPFLVTAVGEQTGMVRIMLFEGEPLSEATTLLDTADPFLPSRAFLIAGQRQNPDGTPVPLELKVETLNYLSPDEGVTLPAPQFFASRGDRFSVPPTLERFEVVENREWENDNGETFYTINIRPIPDVPPNSEIAPLIDIPDRPLNPENLTYAFDYLIVVDTGAGDPVRVTRNICTFDLTQQIAVYTQPSNRAPSRQVGTLRSGEVEILGISPDGGWLLIAFATGPTGAGWIQNNNLLPQDNPECATLPVTRQNLETLENQVEEKIEAITQPEIAVLPTATQRPPNTPTQVMVTPTSNAPILQAEIVNPAPTATESNVPLTPNSDYTSNPPPGGVITFGNVPVMTAQDNSSLVLSNVGSAPLTINFSGIGGANSSEFSLINPTFPQTLSSSGSPTHVTLRCLPSSPGLKAATLIFTTNDPTAPTVTYSLDCNGVLPTSPIYTSSPAAGSTLNFGNVQVNTTQNNSSLSFSNTGTAPLTVNLINISGANNDQFSLVSPSFPVTLNPGDPAVTVTLGCTPSSLGTKAASLNLTTNDSAALNVSYPLSCTGTSLYSSSIAPGGTLPIGITRIGTLITNGIPFTIDNIGGTNLIVSAPSLSGDTTEFSVGGPTFPLTIAPADPPVTVTFDCFPLTFGPRTLTVDFPTNDPFLATASYTVTCTGQNAMVTSLADPGTSGCTPSECTLREILGEVTVANNAFGTVLIDIDSSILPGTITVNSELPSTHPLTFNGTGVTITTGSGNTTIWNNTAANVTLDDVRFNNGGDVGSIQNTGTLTIQNTTILNGVSVGILNNGTLSVINSTIRDNVHIIGTGKGGGIEALPGSSTTINGVDFINNTAQNQGGAISLTCGSMTITGGTFEGNVVNSGTGGILYVENACTPAPSASFTSVQLPATNGTPNCAGDTAAISDGGGNVSFGNGDGTCFP